MNTSIEIIYEGVPSTLYIEIDIDAQEGSVRVTNNDGDSDVPFNASSDSFETFDEFIEDVINEFGDDLPDFEEYLRTISGSD